MRAEKFGLGDINDLYECTPINSEMYRYLSDAKRRQVGTLPTCTDVPADDHRRFLANGKLYYRGSESKQRKDVLKTRKKSPLTATVAMCATDDALRRLAKSRKFFIDGTFDSVCT